MRPQSSLGGDHRRMPMGERDCACHRRGAREIPWIELRGSQGLVEDRGCRFLGVAMDSREIEVLDGFSVSFWIVGFFWGNSILVLIGDKEPEELRFNFRRRK